MARAVRLLPLLAASGLLAATAASAQEVAPTYRLTPSPWRTASAHSESAGAPVLQFGGVTLGAGSGLSLEAGQAWFARAGVGTTLQGAGATSIGGGYRFRDGDAVSVHVTRQLGHEGLGLAVRYDRAAAYLRLSYEAKLGQGGQAEMLRFSAGMRF